MSDSKEIRISIDLTTKQNQSLWEELSKFKPRERNKLIVDALAQYFLYSGETRQKGGNAHTEPEGQSAASTQDTGIMQMLNEVMNRLNQLESHGSGASYAVKEDNRAVSHDEPENNKPLIQRDKQEYKQESEQSGKKEEDVALPDASPVTDSSEEDKADSYTEAATEKTESDIPDEVMAMIMAMQGI